MNERIRELATQAKLRSPLLLQHWGKIDALTDSEQEELENIEKFAELIVRECCQFEKSYGGDAGLVARSFSRKIKQHFGVE